MDEFAILYAACAPMSPEQVDRLEVWEVAAWLGVNRAPKDDEAPKLGTDLLAERVKAAKSGRRVDPRSIAKPTQVGTLTREPPATQGR